MVVWQTATATDGVLEFGSTPDLGNRVMAGGFDTTHSVVVSGLEASSRYYYRVLSGDVPLTETLNFSTNPGADDRDFKFLVFGDSGVGTIEQMRVAQWINRSNAAFGLHTGDIIYIYGEEENYDPFFFYPYARFLSRSVIYPTLGNHDFLTNQGEPYFRNFYLPTNDQTGTEGFYSFDYGHAHIICLNTQDYSGVTSNQRRWLLRDLKQTTKPWKFVFFHMPPYTGGYLDDGNGKIRLDTAAVRDHLVPVFEEYGIDMVFSGHCHSYERTFPLIEGAVIDRDADPWYINPQGPVYVVTGGGGSRLLGLDPSPLNAREALAYHFVEVSINGNELTGRAIGMSGEVIDQFRIVKEDP